MIYLKYGIYLLGMVVGMLSLYSDKKYLKIASSVGIILVCMLGIWDVYSSEIRLSLHSYKVDRTQNSYKAQVTLHSSKNSAFSAFIVKASLPKTSQARIIKISPMGSFSMGENPLQISTDFKTATLTYAPKDMNIIFFEVETDKETQVILEGNYGFGKTVINMSDNQIRG